MADLFRAIGVLSLLAMWLPGAPPAHAQEAAPAARLDGWARQVRPFAVYDSTGAALRFPFLGGLNRPRPQLADIDGDGDGDLFVQERAGRVMFFENTAEGAAPLTEAPFEDRLAFRSAAYAGLDVGQWYRLGDLDADGDLDLLAEQPVSYVRYYRNDGTPAAPSLALAAETLRTTGGAPIFADRRNRPAVLPAGCAGVAPSLLFGGLDGRLRFFQNAGTAPGQVPRLRLVSERYQEVCAGPPSVCSGGGGGGGPALRSTGRHGANALAAGDLAGTAGEGTDVLWGDFFSESFYRIADRAAACDALAFDLTGDTFPAGAPVQTAGFNAADLSDADGDGDDDLIFGVLGGAGGTSTVENLYLLERTATGGYRERTRRLLSMIDAGAESAPAFADLDGDGDDDLVLGAAEGTDGRGARLSFFEHVTEADSVAFRQRPASANPLAALPRGFAAHPAFGDLDGDGDLDLALGTFSGLTLYENTGDATTPRFAAEATLALGGLPAGNYFAPAIADLDGDGMPELVAGTSGGALLVFARVEGRVHYEQASAGYGGIAGIAAGTRAAPAFYDAGTPGDGDLDLYVGTRGGLRFHENTGDASTPRFAEGTPAGAALRLPTLATPTFFDDAAGGAAPSLVVGGESGGLLFFAGADSVAATPSSPERRAPQPVQVAPTPFRGQATVSFRLAESRRVRLTLHDARGRRLREVFAGSVAAGETVRLSLRAGTLASGVYFLHLTTAGGDVLGTGRAVLAR